MQHMIAKFGLKLNKDLESYLLLFTRTIDDCFDLIEITYNVWWNLWSKNDPK